PRRQTRELAGSNRKGTTMDSSDSTTAGQRKLIPGWLFDVELVDGQSLVRPRAPSDKNPEWLDEMRLWFGMEPPPTGLPSSSEAVADPREAPLPSSKLASTAEPESVANLP